MRSFQHLINGLFIALVSTLLFHVNVAQSSTFEFTDIIVDGNNRIDRDTIRSYAGVQINTFVSDQELNDGYRSLVNSNFFSSVEFELIDTRLKILVTEYPTVNSVNFEGNRAISDEVLVGIANIFEREFADPNSIDAGVEALTKFYLSQGRVAARVQSKIIRREDNRVDIVFEIFEGGITEIERIGFVGNRAYSDRQLRSVIATKQAGILRQLVKSDTFIEDRISFDKQKLRDFYTQRGYIDFIINDVNAELSEENDAYFIVFNLREGQQFKFGSINVTSQRDDIDPSVFESVLKVTSGNVYSPDSLEDAIARLEEKAARLGIDFLSVEPIIERDDANSRLNVNFILGSGERKIVERIEIIGNSATLDRVIRREIKFGELDPFNPRLVRAASEKLRSLGYFSAVNISAREGSAADRVIIDVEVVEQPTGSLQLGASYSGDLGLGLLLQYGERNFLGRGQTLDVTVNNSQDSEQYLLAFGEPSFLENSISLDLSARSRTTNGQGANYKSSQDELSVSLGSKLQDTLTANLGLSLRSTGMSKSTGSTGDVIKSEILEGKIDEVGLGFDLSYDNKASAYLGDPRYSLKFDQNLFIGTEGGGNIYSGEVTALYEQGFADGEVIFRSVAKHGALLGDGRKSRSVDRFYMNSSLARGFDYAGVGPRERSADGVIDQSLGGNQYSSLKFEVDFSLPFVPEEYGISAGTYYHVTDIWNVSGRKSTNNEILYASGAPRESLGAVLYLSTPIGPLRLDFTNAISKQKFDIERTFDLSVATRF